MVGNLEAVRFGSIYLLELIRYEGNMPTNTTQTG